MGIRDSMRRIPSEVRKALLGISAYETHKGYGFDLDDQVVEAIREALGGQLQPIPNTKIRWYLADLERAQAQADAGNLTMAAQLWRAMRRDGYISGLMSTRTAGLVRLKKKFYGDDEIARELGRQDGARTVFDDMHPPSELGLMASDGIALGVSVAELVPVEGRDYPVMVRLDPEYLQYRWQENRWYFLSIAGALPITPGDGRWILHVPGGRIAPWNSGLWPAMGRSFINKEHALLHRSNYSAKLANPARIVEAPIGATEPQRKGMLAMMMRWGINSVFELPVGWKASLLESNGIGFKVYQEEIKTSDDENMVTICGQQVTTTGGAGFSNSDIHRLIRADLIEADGENLAYTLNTQSIPGFIESRFGLEKLLSATAGVRWETATPKDLTATATALMQLANAITALRAALAPEERAPEVDELCERFGVDVRDLKPAERATLEAMRSGGTHGDPAAIKEAA